MSWFHRNMGQEGSGGRWWILLLMLFLVLSWYSESRAVDSEGRMSDREVTDAILSSLSFNETITSEKIRVQTQNGIVTLTGSVENLLSKELAVETVQQIRGVRSVIDRLTVRVGSRSDAQIQSDVRRALRQDPAARAYKVGVDVENGMVTLDGDLRSWGERELAVDVVKGVKGVVGVRDAFRIRSQSTRPDAEIAREVKALLKSDVWVDAYRLDVEVNRGYVNLRGTIGSSAERDAAAADALRVDGVKGVYTGDLKVEPWVRDPSRRTESYVVRSDEQIQRDIEAAFSRDPRVLPFQPEIEVRSGIVTINGSVNNLKAKWSAGQDARNTLGVVQVRNYLRVEPSYRPPDYAVNGDIRQSLARDSVLTDDELDVEVIDGVAYLNGSVDSRFEKNRAEDLASRIMGVVSVRNDLEIESLAQRDSTVLVAMSDAELKKAIEDQLVWSLGINGERTGSTFRPRIRVDVRDGVATLTGIVESLRESDAATQAAYRAGARLVQNRLRVQYDGIGG